MANRRQLYEYRGDCCAHCRLGVNEMVVKYGTFDRMFEFNHIDPAKKHPEYDNLIRRVISSDQLDEVDKCILLCRQCHAVLHAQNITGNLHLTVSADGKQATQAMKGHIIADKNSKRVKFLTNERVLAVPYRLRIGEDKPQFCFGTELEQEGLLVKHFRDLPRIKTLTVMAYKGSHVWMRAEHIKGTEITMEQDIRFPVLTAELCGDSEHAPLIWLRNGVALTKDGQVIHNGTVTSEATLVAS